MNFLMVSEVTRIVESFITVEMRASIRLDSTVSIQVSLESLATGELLAADFANVFAVVRVRFGVAVAVAQAGEAFATDRALERLLFGVRPLVSCQVAFFTKSHSAFVAFHSEFALVRLDMNAKQRFGTEAF